MAFQFQCPQGHLLEAEEMDGGKTCQCPYCGLTLAIPMPAGTPSASPPMVTPISPAPAAPVAPVSPPPVGMPPVAPPEPPPVVGRRRLPTVASSEEPSFGELKSSQTAAVDVTEKEELFHIPCPNGHELEVPREMLDETALCPHCNAQFKLRERASVEYQRKKVIREEQKERHVSNVWLYWIVGISVLMVMFLLVLILL